MKVGEEVIWHVDVDTVPDRGRSYFLRARRGELYFAIFFEKSKAWGADLYSLNIDDFLDLEKRGYVSRAGGDKALPPWFPEDVGFEWLYTRMKKFPVSESLSKERKEKISEACEKADTWLVKDYPRSLNKLAVEKGCNTKRFRLWVLTYLVFGPEIEVLQPNNWKKGKFDRENAKRKLGRPCKVGNYFNHKMTAEDKEKFKTGYAKYSGLKKTISRIYDDILVFKYNVKTKDIHKYKNGVKVIRVDGEGSVPSIHQFRYWLKINIGEEKVYRDRFGHEKARNKKIRSQGNYSEDDMNLMGVIERDAYVHEEIPKGILVRQLPKLWVVHLVDRMSSLIVGIGFSHGGEKAEAYRMAEFCAAIDKAEFCRLMGITNFDPDSWPSIGVSPETVTDRGPGSGVNIGSVFATLTPSYSPQSKPLVEASNPKKDYISGGPVHRVSNFTPIELMRHATRNLIASNDSKNVVHKFPNRFLEEDQLCTPATLWRKFEQQGRNSAIQINFETAVRTYLNKDTARLGDPYVHYCGQRYRAIGIDNVATKNNISHEVTIYYMPMNVRQIWAEGEFGLIELSAVMLINDHKEQLHITHQELVGFNEIKKRCNSIVETHKVAVNVERNAITFEETGRGVSPNNVKKGRPKNRSSSAKAEMKLLGGGS